MMEDDYDGLKIINLNAPPDTKSCTELYVEALERLAMPAESIKLKNFPDFNSITGGLRANEFTILCGATGIGKTTFTANISADLLEQEIPHFVASVETGPIDFVSRVMSVLAGEDLNTGDPIPVETLERFNNQYGSYLQKGVLRLSLYEDRFKVEMLIEQIKDAVENHGCKVAIIDNLNFFLEVTRASDQIIEMDRVIHRLIIFVKTCPVHIVMVMHPKKTDNGRVESEYDIKGSSTAVQEAHNVLLFNRASEKAVEAGIVPPNSRELLIAKMRRRGRYAGSKLILTGTCRYEEKDWLT